ncbi:MAG: ankyrin repeat domain-containing protein [Alphaproteobacteria bacterium]|nr:ankyrin repeat domain-containing protein [Alphaproteobacteria bacterium]
MTDQWQGTDNIDPEQRRIVNENLLAGVDAYNTDLINLCLQKGADINTRNADGRTPLMMAVWKDNPSLVRFILSKQPALFLKDNSGKTAYDLIKNVNNAEVKRTITMILLQAMPDAPPLRDPSVDEVIALAEAEAAKPQAAKERISAPKTASFGNKAVPKPPKPFSI